MGLVAFILRRLYEYRNAAAHRIYRDFETRRLWERSMRDPLTGVLNRRGLLSALSNATAKADAGAHSQAALFLLGIDGLEHINDVYGRTVGDSILRIVVERFRAVTHPKDEIAKLEGSEFVVLTRDLDRAAAEELGQKLIGSLTTEILVDRHPHQIVIWTGATMFDGPRRTPAEILNEADLAMRRAKETRRAGPVFYNTPIED